MNRRNKGSMVVVWLAVAMLLAGVWRFAYQEQKSIAAEETHSGTPSSSFAASTSKDASGTTSRPDPKKNERVLKKLTELKAALRNRVHRGEDDELRERYFDIVPKMTENQYD